MKVKKDVKWGYLREKRKQASGYDADNGLSRTALIDYLLAIFPDTKEDDWINCKIVDTIPKEQRRGFKPDYRNEEKKLIIEFDGADHYTNIKNIKRDLERNDYYEKYGYKVIRIPYFIQLTKSVIMQMFGVEMEEEMFPEGIGSMGPNGDGAEEGNTPAFIPHQGIIRMANEFKNFPEQYKANMDDMKKYPNQQYVEWERLEEEYNKLK